MGFKSHLTNAEIFDRIYRSNTWGFGSGSGSIPMFNKSYLEFVNGFLRAHKDIKTIVEIGCGDWQIGKYLDLAERMYIGCDVSGFIIEKVQKRFSSPHVQFLQLDAVRDGLPIGDLVIVKDVLQHLPNQDVFRLLQKLDVYPRAIVQNDILTGGTRNRDISPGAFRPLDITAHPFNAKSYRLVCVYTEVLRRPLNFVRHLVGAPPIQKGIFVMQGF